MKGPLFFIENIAEGANTIVLDEATAKHVVQVLRMQNGEVLNLTDGKGNLLTTIIADNNKKHCTVTVQSMIHHPRSSSSVSIAISILKNASRLEWFLEKAAEIGVNEIIPLISDRTERTHFRYDRMNAILISAMLQSQQSWLPVLHEPVEFDALIVKQPIAIHKLIAHCEEDSKQSLASISLPDADKLILIGPEGDFSKEEISLALANNFIPVSLGNTRLRTETAGIVAATLLCADR